ncbi:MAG TPA: periplasmic nitrate reductase, NapE protein [Rhodopila sp.]
MPDMGNEQAPDVAALPARARDELLVFLLLAVVIWPVLTVGLVGGYGFAIWMQQQVFGPPHAADISRAE